ncbi:helix-turn-helix domain-containing protein [Methylobacterium gnaphalii]|uniref:Helix-turn-helix domain-containing protein n=1 Tax=Methylobacterium gnaphalii TaxID=1010610 RepID=A0A512JPZ2_9HYPH|nr:helix-turn-helix domain-containing protein [Methylobacterium gnaphalii]GEP12012.1 hypothetical protein MGN01_38570 [Methylobacterium gnaphalii]GLS51224.1 hypothetical protein GCM10007885_40790 [Methylobacterium gnaphalii]
MTCDSPFGKKSEDLACIQSMIRTELSSALSLQRAEWLTTDQTAMLLQICATSLEKARSTGRGPLASIPYAKIGRSVRYARADVVAAVARLRVPGSVSKI